jgi:hypothetical protein
VRRPCNIPQRSLHFSISANDAIFIIDTSKWTTSDCNLRIDRATGYSYSELKGLHNSKLFPDEFKRDIRYFLKYNLDRNIPSMKPLSKQNLM